MGYYEDGYLVGSSMRPGKEKKIKIGNESYLIRCMPDWSIQVVLPKSNSPVGQVKSAGNQRLVYVKSNTIPNVPIKGEGLSVSQVKTQVYDRYVKNRFRGLDAYMMGIAAGMLSL